MTEISDRTDVSEEEPEKEVKPTYGTIMFYDGKDPGADQRRLDHNVKLMGMFSSDGIEYRLTPVGRKKEFRSETCADVVLDQSPLQFDWFVINGFSNDASDVLETAQMACEIDGLPGNRIIYLGFSNLSSIQECGGSFVLSEKRDGYFTDKDVNEIFEKMEILNGTE